MFLLKRFNYLLIVIKHDGDVSPEKWATCSTAYCYCRCTRYVFSHYSPVFVELSRVVCDVQVFLLECRMCFFIRKTL